ncbi:hypothetical protein S7711_01922 [Stachybotrys chartarum IBT 7711]|uniref:Major facilitator superfamily (MFS) profile domain-containing protein n=1 Tax=Stachybotrys chartarum (strain CBS 109288 / IBT 7711) TaxID=1280523 RepID=A0A084AMU8_STACB|nr:hypothetical protein S7711_01922 [Stachybotrys chartarum IBT 7711]
MEAPSSDSDQELIFPPKPTVEQIRQFGSEAVEFALQSGLEAYQEDFRKASCLNLINVDRDDIEGLTQEEKDVLAFEDTHRWSSSPTTLYMLCALCAGCAVVQGMDQTVINGAQSFYFAEFGITNKLMQGFLNGAPYVSASLLGCWLNAPLNKLFGRRGTIWFSCLLAIITALWQAAANSWANFLVARLVLGLAVGAKSSTTPVYAAECAPKRTRGALTMMWQMWTAFGIMLGFVVSLVFQDAGFMGPNTQWRWMLGVTAVPPTIVAALVYTMPESPRWYMDRGDYIRAFQSMRRLRMSSIQAARDLYHAYTLIETDKPVAGASRNGGLLQQIRQRRVWRAAQSAWFLMFMQQFCGVNIIAYYSTSIFTEAGYSRETALAISLGTGACNFLGAIPAIFSIDRFGRRKLLLCTFPLMAIFLLLTGGSFSLEGETKLKVVATALYLFMLIYSPGMGPVPFTYSAEAFPLHVRAIGMSSATAITWMFNFIISFTWPKMMQTMTPAGGFYFYAAWNVFGFIFTFFLLPETKNRTLEELDSVFAIKNRDHARWHAEYLRCRVRKLLGLEVPAVEPVELHLEKVPLPASPPPSA